MSPQLTPALAETLALFEAGGAPLTTTEAATALDVGRRSAYDRLRRLADGGHLGTKGVGASGRVWWRPTPTDEAASAARPEREMAEVFDRIDDGFLALDEAGRLTHVNERAETMLDRPARALVGHTIREAVPDAIAPELERAVGRAVRTGETVTYEAYIGPMETWVEVRTFASETGLSVYVRDVTERKRLRRELRIERDHFRTALQNSPLVAFRLDTDLRYVWVGNPHEDFDPDAVIGKRDDELLPPEAAAVITEPKRRALETGERVREEVTYDLPSGTVSYDLTVEPVRDETGEIVGLTAASLDLSDRKLRERALREGEARLRLALGAAEMGVWELDLRSGESPERSPRHDAIFGYDPPVDDWSLDRFFDHVVPEDRAAVRERFDAATESGEWSFECRIDRADGARRWIAAEGEFEFDDDGEPDRGVGTVRDVTDRIEREHALAASERRYRGLAENFPDGGVSLFDRDLRYTLVEGQFFDDVDVDPASLVGTRVGDSIPDPETAESMERAYRDALAGTATEFEIRWAGYDLRLHVVPVDDGTGVVSGGMMISRDITDERERERELERRHDQLAALNHLHDTVRGIAEAVIDRSSRADIERVVCERLAASESYLFAWIGDVDSATRTIGLRTEAGVEGYLDDTTVSVDPDDPRSAVPTGRAVLTGEFQVARDLHGDDGTDTWNGQVERYGFRSSAAVPIAHEGTTYGVLTVYAERPEAFAGGEGEVLAGLGEVIGHAIAAADRKRALLSDELVELEFSIPELSRIGDADGDGASDGRVEFDHVVHVRDEVHVLFGRASDGGGDTVRALADRLPYWTGVTFGADGERFEVRLSEPPVLSTAASLGGSFEGAVLADGDFRLRFHLSPSVEAGLLVDAVREAYPHASLVRRRQVPRPDGVERVRDAFEAALTDRQRATLAAAYHAGYFEWPRAADGETVASTLGITGPTFHQHLRSAEEKLFASLLSPAA